MMSLPEAVSYVADGSSVAIAGNMDLSPMAFVREIIRSGKRNLRIIGMPSSAINLDMLIGSGSATEIEAAQVSLGEFGLARNFRRAFEAGTVKVFDHVCPALLSAYQAGAMGLPFMPVRGLLGTDYLRIRPDFRVIDNPYNEGEKIVVVPAIRPDVGVFHGFQADTLGNVVTSNIQSNRLLANASRFVVATVEEIVEPGELDRGKGVFVPAAFIDAVVHAPMGAHPTRCPGYYPVDVDHMKIYAASSKTAEDFARYLEEYVLSTGDEAGYLARVRSDGARKEIAAAGVMEESR